MEWRLLQLFALAYNVGDFARGLALPRWVGHGSLSTGVGRRRRRFWLQFAF